MPTSPSEFDLAQLVERAGFGRFLIRLVIVSWLVTFFDGFDSNVIAYAAPGIIRQFGLTRAAMGNVFSLGIVGTMIGGFVFGYLADRFGRRPAILAAVGGFAVLTLSLALSRTLPQVTALRFVDGIFTGGLLPPIWALNIEYAPRRFRSTVVTLIMLGYSLGTSLGGPISAWLVPTRGWQVLFLTGGALSALAFVPLYLLLPESMRFLAVRGRARVRIVDLVTRLDPGAAVPAEADFVLADEAGRGEQARFALRLLFVGRLRWITPLLWLAYIASSMAVYFMATWIPVVAEAMGLSPAQAAAAGSIGAVGSATGGLALMRFVDRYGAISITFMPLLAIPVLLVVGGGTLSPTAFLGANFLIAVFIVGGHSGLHSIAGIFYPSAYRSNGAGWATSVAKVGSILGPWIAGIAMSRGMPPAHLFVLMTVCPAVVAGCMLPLGLLQRAASAASARLL